MVKNGSVTDEIVYLDAAEEAQFTIAQASAPLDEKTGRFLRRPGALPLRARARPSPRAPQDVEYMDVAPAQIVSVATALIPFLEHNDANRALMGANMQRQAVPLMITAGAARSAPGSSTGPRSTPATSSSPTRPATVVDVDAGQIVVETQGRQGRLRT